MKKLNKEQKESLVNVIKQMTGAESVVLMLADTQIPCEEDLQYGSCATPHMFEALASGFRGEHQSGFLLGWMEQTMRQIASHPTHILLNDDYQESPNVHDDGKEE